MNISKINIGIVHSLIGKNDGVSIVIDQSLLAMQEYLGVPLNNIFFLCAIAPSRLNKIEDNIFWHKSDENRYILRHYTELPKGRDNHIQFEQFIETQVQRCMKRLISFVSRYEIDLLIVHNSCHPTNFIYSVAVGRYVSILKHKKKYFPRYLLWWHDSHMERPRFSNPNLVIQRYLKYIPGPQVDGVVFINSIQEHFAKQYFSRFQDLDFSTLFRKKSAVIPNTCDVEWNWRFHSSKGRLSPQVDPFNLHFFDDIGLTSALRSHQHTIRDAVILLQHTRIVRRKRIDVAIDFAFKIAEELKKDRQQKPVVLLVSGHSGDEDDKHLKFLKRHFKARKHEHEGKVGLVLLIFAEARILPEREIVVDKRYYRFKDIPGLVAHYGGLGTYFSEVEGFGNNLLEMVSMGLPVAINEYEIYKSDIKPMGFQFPSVENNVLTKAFVRQSYELISNPEARRSNVLNNLEVLETKLNHQVMAKKLGPVIVNTLSYL